MNKVVRQVSVFLQNHTAELLSLEQAVAIQGAFAPPEPVIGATIQPQGAGHCLSVCYDINGAAQGTLRYGSTKGYIQISWTLPADASNPTHSVTTPPGIDYEHVFDNNQGVQVVYVVTLNPSPSRKESPASQKTSRRKAKTGS